MSQPDDTKEFLNSLPELEPGKKYSFKCYPGISCFNECCSDLELVLTPYDILRLRRHLNRPSKDFINHFTDSQVAMDTGFPLLRLHMTDNAKRSCPFVRTEGCSVYPNRPGACRMYPLGRATRPDGRSGITEQFFVVREDHCKGFEEQDEWTGREWLEDQGFKDYIRFNDRYMRLLSRMKQAGRTLPPKVAEMAMLALYQPEDYQRFIQEMGLFDKLEVDEERQKKILSDEEEALAFGLDWLETMLFADYTILKPKPKR